MKPALPSLFLLSVLLAGCATSEGPTAARSSVTPVGHVEQQIRARVGALQTQQGAQLLTSIETLIKCGALARKPVIEGLNASDPRVRASLVYVLGFIGGPEGAVAVSERLQDTDAGVRYEAAAALLQLGDVSGLPVLIQLLEDSDARVRYKSIEALVGVAGQNFGYEFKASPAERAPAVQRIRSWWQERSTARVTAGQNP